MYVIGIFVIGYILGVIGAVLVRRKPKNIGELHINLENPDADIMDLRLNICSLDELYELKKAELTITRK